MKLNERLKLLREDMGLSQKEFAERNGIEVSKYNKWENDKYSPGYGDLCNLAKIFNCTTDYLLGYSEYKNVEEKELVASVLNSLSDHFENFSPKEKFDVMALLTSITITYGHLRQYNNYHNDYLKCLESIYSEISDTSQEIFDAEFHKVPTGEDARKDLMYLMHGTIDSERGCNEAVRALYSKYESHIIGLGIAEDDYYVT